MELSSRYLLDTNAVIYFVNGRIAQPLPDAIIAASAVLEEAVLMTNDQGFAAIDGRRIESLQLSIG